MDASGKLTLDRFIADADSAGPLNEEQLRDLLVESTERRSALKELEARILWRLLAERDGQTPISVKVKHPEIEHTVRVQDFERWLETTPRSPAEMILKNRLRELLAKGR